MHASITVFMDRFQTTFANFCNYFKSSPISTSFFIFLFLVATLNVVREIIMWSEKKKVVLGKSCKYLNVEKNEQSCDLNSRKEDFASRGNSCEGCKGKTISITREEIEERASNEAIWKRNIVLLAKYSRNILPYMSFFYTLAIAIFEK